MMVALVATSVAASAQVYIGGGIGFSSNRASYLDVRDASKPDAVTSFTIMPEVGYNLDDKWTVGIGLGYTYTSNYLNHYDDGANEFTINPYARYHFAQWGNVKLFVQGGVYYSYLSANEKDTEDEKGDEYSQSTFGIGFKPGINIALNDKLSFVATLGNLGWKTSTPDYGGELDYKGSSDFSFAVDLTQINLSLYYSF